MRFEAASLLTPKPARARPHGLAGVQLLLDAFLQRDPPAMFCPCDATSLAWVPGTVVVALMAGSVRAGRLTSVMPETIDPTAPDLLRRTPLFVRAGHEGWTHTTEGRHMFGAIRDRILPGIEAYERAGRDDVTQRLPAALAALDVPSAARSYHYMVHTGATLIHQAGVAAGATAGASERLLWPTRQEFGFSDLDAALRARLDEIGRAHV